MFEGGFYLIFSPLRFRLVNKEKFCEQVSSEMGPNAIPHYGEHLFDTTTMKWDVSVHLQEGGKRIPFVRGLWKAIKREKPDVLFTVGYFQWTPIVLLFGVLHRIPVYMGYERTPHTERNRTWLHKLHRKFFNRFFRGFMVNGSETRKYLESLGVEASRIHTAGMCADSANLKREVKAFRESAAYSAFKKEILGDVEEGGLCFLFNGKLDERKGVTHLLDAWRTHVRSYPNDHLVMVGTGRQQQLCNRMAEDMPSVHLVGWQNYAEMPKYYAIADVSIMPTLEDNWSLVVPEAMACGLPVTTSIYNGCYPELIHEGVNGYTFDTLKHETIVTALGQFHTADLAAMQRASLALEEPFNTENSARRVYEAVVKDLKS